MPALRSTLISSAAVALTLGSFAAASPAAAAPGYASYTCPFGQIDTEFVRSSSQLTLTIDGTTYPNGTTVTASLDGTGSLTGVQSGPLLTLVGAFPTLVAAPSQIGLTAGGSVTCYLIADNGGWPV
ncbi:hypothetical protein GCM10023205_59880 [Yinghuangia aomiensis]|uniref:Uncharacterized protein n=1 Tax=Yinghuangia aomiensis TaxID=676205 RepID=A0ABP9HYF4_9ACTN